MRKITTIKGRLARRLLATSVVEDAGRAGVLDEQTSREELRAVEASQLTEVGVNAEGDPVILCETEYAPGVHVSPRLRVAGFRPP